MNQCSHLSDVVLPVLRQTSISPQKPLSPEAVEAARRGYNAGLRALAYGSVLGLGVVRRSHAAHGQAFVADKPVGHSLCSGSGRA